MIEIMGEKFLTEKEAASRYGYSTNWFAKARYEGKSPKFVRLNGKGRVLYPMYETDIWFKDNMVTGE